MRIDFRILFLLIGVTLIFSWPVLKGFSPFPGDLLVSEYNPWKTYSYLGYDPGGYPNKAQYFDVIRQLYPYRILSMDLVKKGEFPLWNPYNFSGAPLLADFQSAVFYPFNLFFLFLNEKYAWSILVILQPFLAMIFTYIYAKKIGISSLGSILSAISYGFSYFMIVWLESNIIGNVILWLPLVLLSLERLTEKFDLKWSVIFVFSIVSSLFAGHPQVFGYLFIFSLIYFLFRTFVKKTNKFTIFSLLFLYLVSAGVGAIQILPGMELTKEAARSPYTYQFFVDKVLIQSWHLIMAFVPDFFGNPATRNYWLPDTYVGKVTSIGLVPLLFVTYIFFKKRKALANFFLASAALVLLLITANPFTLFLYKINILFVSSSAPNLSSFILVFSLSILAGMGVDLFLKDKISIKKTFYYLLPVISVFLILWVGIFVFKNYSSFEWVGNLSISTRNLIYSSIILALAITVFLLNVYLKGFTKFFLIILILLHTFDLFRAFHKFNPFVPYELVFPDAPIFTWLKKNTGLDRFWGFGSGNVEANFATQYKLFSTDGLDPLYPRRYGEFIQSSKEGKIVTKFTRETRSDAFIAQGNDINLLVNDTHKLRVLDSLAVKYFLFREDGSSTFLFPKERFREVYRDNEWIIQENLKSYPRVFLSTNIREFKTNKEFEDIFFGEEKVILLEKDLALDRKVEDGKTDFISYSPGKMTLRTESENDNLLYVSETYYPGWKAYVDGNETKIHRANYAFMSLLVPAGKHNVYLEFEPSSVKMGALISLGSIVLFTFVILALKNYKSYKIRQSLRAVALKNE